ncbi:type II toxin-antitoxin system prevent-host-death family antitoxin [Microbacterium sp. MEC084]|uniref:type II toxin-antitoxin system Phd/YefM family antitoxin n=1 Tax=unclassified Microbacterium TaxID=2609290 RepID=UPI0006F20842|nr:MULTISPECIES: type II toxin-antitoxin system prevent-host-death family antitoxin [unclassified Microbacterium]KQZ04898.1 prevent-host-death protein [Microbacterium sp. Root53]MCD1267513.1 type II toxin-antitoxin system prevent-host-death family antitoxin [Microbacterium sp. MEC084]
MSEIGIRELKQNASAVVARVTAGETVVITDRRRPVAQLSPLPQSPLEQLRTAGQARTARRSLDELGMPPGGIDESGRVTAALLALREDERH